MAWSTLLTSVIVLQLWIILGSSFLLIPGQQSNQLQPQPQLSRSYCMNHPNDPNFPEQSWYLGDKSPDNYYGINVVKAWNKCYNGTGILVGVVDVGIDTSNPDLRNQVAWKHPLYAVPRLQHGTEVAGLIAAEANNGIFGTGIAFGAKLADLAYVIAGQNIPIAAEALNMAYQHGIDIYSCSFSRGIDGQSVYKIPDDLRQTMENGARSGRNGKGSLYIVSSGNGGEFFVPESCAYDEFMNNVNAILVAGIDPTLGAMPTGEKCGAVMVTAPTRTIGNNIIPKMLTTSGSGTTNNFGMTSAAVAITSGSIAVLLSARPELSHRDVMHILTRTARNSRTLPFKPSPTPFTCNGAGFAVSPQFGFGLLDVDAMVDEARQWQLVGRKITCKAVWRYFVQQMGPKAEYKLNVDPSCQIRYLEHIEVSMAMSDSHAGTLVVDLTSPSSFKSNILPGRAMDHRTSINITVASVQFWGNDPRGEWTISVYNKYFNLNGNLQDYITLTLHGLEQEPLRPMREYCESAERSTRDSDGQVFQKEDSRRQHDDSSQTTGIAVGVTVGGIVCFGVAIVTVFVLHRRKSRI